MMFSVQLSVLPICLARDVFSSVPDDGGQAASLQPPAQLQEAKRVTILLHP